jgi:Phosphotransferase enzyme family
MDSSKPIKDTYIMSNHIWQFQFHNIILHSTEPRVLMLAGADGWSLPLVRLTGEEFHEDLIRIRQALREDLGVDTIMLRCLRMDIDRQTKQADFIHVLEQYGAPAPALGPWVEMAELSELKLAIPDHRHVIETCLLEDASDEIPGVRPPWARRGWFSLAEAWITERLSRLDYTLIAPIEQIRSWGISSVLVAHTTMGDMYFKAIPSVVDKRPGALSHGERPPSRPLLFGNEPALLRALAAFYPNYIPTPIAIDKERVWMLLRDFGPTRLRGAEVQIWEEMISIYGQLQVSSVDHLQELLAVGCLDRNLEVLSTQIDPLLTDAEVLSHLTANEIEQLHRLAPWLKEQCSEIAKYKVPLALVHGDLHPGNIAVQDGGYVFFDWTDASVAHPFFDLVTIFRNGERFADAPNTQIRLRDAYLAQWTAYEPTENLITVFTLAQTLGALHQAVSFQHIVANLEAASKREQYGGLRFWLRALLDSASNLVGNTSTAAG